MAHIGKLGCLCLLTVYCVHMLLDHVACHNINIVGNPKKAAPLMAVLHDGVLTDRPTDKQTNRPMDLPTDIVMYRAAEVQIKRVDGRVPHRPTQTHRHTQTS